MKIPLHLKPEDRSAKSSAQRLAMWNAMMAANPKGFRIPSLKRGRLLDTLQMRLNGLRVETRYGV